ncbi:uncharacterized protein LOC116194548 [Punica granatum]|uniref:Uncharacterized protein LOC116194548 n=1 Tax=Punica granatum TaxID=22663 RepID=A0A6P8C9X2_PUNGR|nr:uncharacterized protein LOC116194548 [Punica granatum]
MSAVGCPCSPPRWTGKGGGISSGEDAYKKKKSGCDSGSALHRICLWGSCSHSKDKAPTVLDQTVWPSQTIPPKTLKFSHIALHQIRVQHQFLLESPMIPPETLGAHLLKVLVECACLIVCLTQRYLYPTTATDPLKENTTLS